MNGQDYTLTVLNRLKQKNYHIKDNVLFNNQLFEHVAKKTRFEYVAFYTTFFVFSEFITADIQTLQNFSSKAFKYCRTSNGVIPPLGLIYALRCIPVAIVDSISEETSKALCFQDPPKHWAAPEKLVVFSLGEQKLVFWELSFTEDYLDADLDRQIIKEMLSP